MQDETLRALVEAIRVANARATDAALQHLPEAASLRSEEQSLLQDLSTQLDQRDELVAELTQSLSDRLNNLLMVLQTVSDLLRHPIDDETAARLRRQLNDTVQDGTEAVKHLSEAVGRFR